MADDSELDYLKTFLAYASPFSTVKHFSDVKKISAINTANRLLIFPGELMGVDGKFYIKRYKVQVSEPSEALLMVRLNKIIEVIDDLSKGQEEISAYYTGTSFCFRMLKCFISVF